MTMSCQPRPHPQASGTAAATASSGTTTNTPTRNRSRRLVGSASISGIGTRLVTVGASAAEAPRGAVVPGRAVVSGGAFIVNLALLSAGAAKHRLCGWVTPRTLCESTARWERCDAYVTVTYETVGCTTPAGKLYQEVRWAVRPDPKAVSLSETRNSEWPASHSAHRRGTADRRRASGAPAGGRGRGLGIARGAPQRGQGTRLVRETGLGRGTWAGKWEI